MMAQQRNPHAWTRRRWLQATPACALWPGASLSLAGNGAQIEWPVLGTVTGQVLQPAHWQGVPSVVVFWATWCGYCRRHNAHVDRLYRSVDAGRLRVLGVARWALTVGCCRPYPAKWRKTMCCPWRDWRCPRAEAQRGLFSPVQTMRSRRQPW